MGIEPTLAAWEAAVLPLNYARMTPRPRTCSCPMRARTAPEGSGGFRTRLATGHLAEVGSLSGRGHRFSPRIRPVTGRRSLSPRSSTRYGIAKPCGLSSPRLPDAVTGLPCSALTTGTGRVPPFHRWRFCQRVLTKQQDNRPHPVLGRAYQSLWPFKLHGVYQRFAFANPSAQPSASSVTTTDFSLCSSRRSANPNGWLHCQRAQHLAVTSYALRLGYERLDTRSDRGRDPVRQLRARLSPSSLTPRRMSLMGCSSRSLDNMARRPATDATQVARLGSSCSTIELHPPRDAIVAKLGRRRNCGDRWASLRSAHPTGCPSDGGRCVRSLWSG